MIAIGGRRHSEQHPRRLVRPRMRISQEAPAAIIYDADVTRRFHRTSDTNAGVTDQGDAFALLFVKCAVEGVLENRSETVIQCDCGMRDFRGGTIASKDNPYSHHTLLNEIH
jgi:hypothetical protein